MWWTDKCNYFNSRPIDVKTDSWRSTFAERNSGPLKRHLLLARTPPLYQCHAWLGVTQYSAACQIHIQCTLNWTAGGRQAGQERGRMEELEWEGSPGGWGMYGAREGIMKR